MGADLADMQLRIKCNKQKSLFVVDIDSNSKYIWLLCFNDKKKKNSFTNSFQNVLNEFKSKPNKIRIDKGSEFYNKSMKSWLQGNDIEIHSTHNIGRSVTDEKFIRTLKNRICKFMTYIKMVHIDKLAGIVN